MWWVDGGGWTVDDGRWMVDVLGDVLVVAHVDVNLLGLGVVVGRWWRMVEDGGGGSLRDASGRGRRSELTRAVAVGVKNKRLERGRDKCSIFNQFSCTKYHFSDEVFSEPCPMNTSRSALHTVPTIHQPTYAPLRSTPLHSAPH